MFVAAMAVVILSNAYVLFNRIRRGGNMRASGVV
jgi:hypothetical protein